MTARTPTALKVFFQTGDTPTQSQFGDVMDSYINVVQASGQTIVSPVSVQSNLEVKGNFTVSGTSTLTGVLALSNNLTISSSGNASISGNLTVTASSPTALTGNLTVTGRTILANASANVPAAGATDGSVATMTNFTQGANGSGYVLISATAANNVAQVTFTSLPATFDQYELRYTSVKAATNNATLQVQYSEDNGSSFKSTAYVFEGNATTGAGANAPFGNVSASNLVLANSGVSNSSDGATGRAVFTSFGSNSLDKNYFYQSQYNSSTTFFFEVGGGLYTGDVGIVNAFKVFFSAGNMSGKLALYGIRNS